MTFFRVGSLLKVLPVFCVPTVAMSRYSIQESGTPYTLSYKVYFRGPNGIISPFHDIPLHHDNASQIFNMVVEIPRWTNAKMEISKGDIFNPIKQDVKSGKLRFVDNVFPYKGYIWNYGALPQTWEDPNHVDPGTNCKGDNDPVDVCDLSSRVHKRGSVVPVKVLGVLGLIDEGETDWKVIAIDVNDPMADLLNDIEDVEKYMPGYLRATRDWFRRYKMPTGKPPNEFAFNGEFKDKKFTLDLICETHKQWQGLVAKDVESHGIMCENVNVGGSPYQLSREDAKEHLEKVPPFTPTTNAEEPGGEAGEKWHFPAN